MSRFHPTRAGIVNLWDYTDHEFAFHGGRLVLRGANGSGKTKALELLFPFLFDASIAPQRLDPFSGAGRTMRDNLLYRPDRDSVTGYAWLEFGHDDGRFVVVGAGLRGQRARTDVTTWYFVADRPLGDSWSLVDDDRRPLSLGALREVLGADNVYERPAPFRQRVDHELFGDIGVDRYAALIQLVLYLRRPQLAKDLDLRQLSSTLSAGLRPLDDELLAEGARSFEDLEAVQHELERLERACRAAEQFVRAYVPYVRVVARSRTDRVLDAQRATRRARQAIDDAAHAGEAAERAIEDAQRALDEATLNLRRYHDERDALRRSEAYQAAGQLEDLRRHVGAARANVDRARAEQDRASAQLERAVARRDEAARDHSADVAAAHTGFELMRASATTAVPRHLAAVDALASVEAPGPVAIAAARERRLDLDAVRDALVLFERAADDARRAERELAAATEALDRAETALAVLTEAERDSRAALVVALSSWRERWSWTTELDAATLDAEAAASLTPDVRAFVLAATTVSRQLAATTIARLGDEAGRLEAERAGLVDERAHVLAERDDAPAPPAAARRDRNVAAGAPLWRVVDFVPGLDDAARAGIEAALQAAGLLDAWIAPAGADVSTELDSFLRAHVASDGDATLAGLLVPDVPSDAAVAVADVRAVLASVTLDGLGCRVGVDGRFALGPLHGRSAKAAAEFIGATARANRRARRAAELAAAIAALDTRLAAVAAQRAEAADRLAAYERSLDDLPSIEAVRSAVRAVADAAAACAVRRADHERRQQAAADAAARRVDAGDVLRAGAATRSLPDDRAGLDGVADALSGFEAAAQAFHSARERELRAARVLAQHDEQRRERAGEHDECGRQVVERRGEHAALAAQLATLEDVIGADVAEVMDALARVDLDIGSGDAAVERCRGAHLGAMMERQRTQALIERAVAEHERAHSEHADGLERVRVLRRPELRAALDLDDATDLDAYVALVDDATRGTAVTDERRQATKTTVRAAFQQLESQLGPRYHASLDDDDDVDLAMVTDEDGRAGVASFTARITQRRDGQRTLLSAQERQVLEDTLIDTLCRQLHHRLRDGEEQVARMNRSLGGRVTTSGKGVQLTWTMTDDLSEDQRQIVKLLDRDPAYIGPDRERLREALAHEIRAARANDPAAGYQQILAEVLDYRSWRTFGVRLREPDGTERLLTRKLFNQHSGGERATILHLPLFAAAAAHFEAASPCCPRLVALDEAFAGIDSATTRQLLALTVEFDLDVFLTGHDFWGTVPEVPALAIVQLSHDRSNHTVSSLAMRWDGSVIHHEP